MIPSKEKKMKKIGLLVSLATAAMLIVTACNPYSTPVVKPPTQVVPPTVAVLVPETGSSVDTQVMVGKDTSLGSFLVDSKGMSLYLFTKDTPNLSNCYEKCATAWPPLLTTGKPVAGPDVDASKLGTTERTDGTMQVTYNGWPLYYYVKDMKVGDVVGQDVGQVWYVISPAGEQVMPQAAPMPVESAATVMIGNDAKLGDFLVDAKGMSLYLYTKDTPNTSVCYDKCATAWPPLLVEGAPTASQGIDGAKLGTTTRTDGTKQVTFNGWPLYYYIKDTKAGDVVGQGVGTVWYLLTPAGEMIPAS
jgi:predicted lipoprotein with Yx(FWY)xxD motif